MSNSSPPPINRQRLAEARRLGQSPRSPELTAGLVLLVAGLIVPACVPNLLGALQQWLAQGFTGTRFASPAITSSGPLAVIVTEVARLLGACFMAAIVSDMVQVGFVWSPVAALPHPARLAGWQGGWPVLERLASLALKVGLGGGLLLAVLRFELGKGQHFEDPQQWLAHGVSVLSLGLVTIGSFCLFMGGLDAWLRRKRWIEGLQMSDDEQRRQ